MSTALLFNQKDQIAIRIQGQDPNLIEIAHLARMRRL